MKSLTELDFPVIKDTKYPVLDNYKIRKTVRAFCYFNCNLYMYIWFNVMEKMTLDHAII